MKYIVGRNDRKFYTNPQGRLVQKEGFSSLEDAEAYIARLESIDPHGVKQGHYYIDGPE